MRLWDKGVATDELILAYTVGTDYAVDNRLVRHDILASKAHARMLGKCGHLQPAEVDRLCVALDEIAASHDAGEWTISIQEEDCHTAIEGRLTEKLGELGGKIHLGRSRNDQVLTALRLALRADGVVIVEAAKPVAEAIEALARRHEGVPLPGYTHMQRGMPSSVLLWASGYAAEIRHSLESFLLADHLLSLNPLGSAAGYGTPGLELDREATTVELGFSEPQEPVTAAQLSRGKAEAAMAFACCLLLQDLGRLAADLCLFNTQEFGFVTLAPEFTTGSSIMPQKRNPDVFELVRGTSAQAPACLSSILAVTAKMPSGYHRDLQLIKKTIFDLVDQTLLTLEVMARALDGVSFNLEKVGAAMTPDLFAAQRAFDLVRSEGISFREAYRRVAGGLQGHDRAAP